jgi:HEAT repeat protein
MRIQGPALWGTRRGLRLAVALAIGFALGLAGGVAAAQAPRGPEEDLPVFRALERIARDAGASLDDRLAAIAGLGDARHPSTVATLLAALGDPLAAIRAGAARALGWPGNGAAVEPLVARARDAAEDRDVRVAAIDALGRIGAPAAVGTVEALSGDGDVVVRRAALLALMESALAPHADQVGAALRLLADVAQEGHPRARAAALLGGVRGDARVLPALLAALRETRPPTGYDALPVPGTLAGMQQTMAQRLRSLNNVRAHAAWALGGLGDRAAVPDLLAVLADPDPAVRLRSAGALGLLGAREAVPRLVDLLSDEEALVRAMAATALGGLDDRSAGPAVRGALRDADARVRERAAQALGRLGDQEAREELGHLAATESVPAVRQAAYAALRALGAAREGGQDSGQARPPASSN